MKIRIITFQRADNYGATLQCYALYSYIKKINLDTKVVDYRNPYIESQYNILPEKNKIVKLLAFFLKSMLPKYKWQFIRKKRFETFRKNIAFTHSVTKAEIKEKGIKCDLLISGSDQVLNPDITNGFDDIYYLDFTCIGVKATYAASIGDLKSEYFKEKNFLDKLNNIDFFSIREQDACCFIRNVSKREAVKCVDPTLLLEINEWDNLIRKVQYTRVPDKFILLYYLERNQTLIDAAEKLAMDRGIPVLYFKKNAKLNCAANFCGDAGPLEFVWLIKHASVILTSSFHASVFSLLYDKEVYIMAHSKTGSRVGSLADLFNANEVIFTSLDEFESKIKFHANSRFNHNQLEVLKDKSKKYIENIMKETELKNE